VGAIAFAAWAGGLAVIHLGLMHTPWIGAVIVLGALALTYWSGRLDAREGFAPRAAGSSPAVAH
jgi:DHA1 family inner membrane transport protein